MISFKRSTFLAIEFRKTKTNVIPEHSTHLLKRGTKAFTICIFNHFPGTNYGDIKHLYTKSHHKFYQILTIQQFSATFQIVSAF